MENLKKILFSSLIVSFCMLPTMAHAEGDLKAQWGNLFNICNRIYFPNSMAMSNPNDATKITADLIKQKETLSQGFANPAGIQFLSDQYKKTSDDVEKTCLFDVVALLAKKK